MKEGGVGGGLALVGAVLSWCTLCCTCEYTRLGGCAWRPTRCTARQTAGHAFISRSLVHSRVTVTYRRNSEVLQQLPVHGAYVRDAVVVRHCLRRRRRT